MTMQYTPLLKLPYPDSAESAETWQYWQQLAETADTALGGGFTEYTPNAYKNDTDPLGSGTAKAWYALIGPMCFVYGGVTDHTAAKEYCFLSLPYGTAQKGAPGTYFPSTFGNCWFDVEPGTTRLYWSASFSDGYRALSYGINPTTNKASLPQTAWTTFLFSAWYPTNGVKLV